MAAFSPLPVPNGLLHPIQTAQVQAEDWKHLRRAAFLYQEIYVQLRELTYNRVLLDVLEEDGELHVIKDGSHLFACKGEHAVRRFPRHLFQDQNNAEAMLLYRGCEDILDVTRPLFSKLIRPYCYNVFLRWVVPSKTQLKIFLHPSDDMFGSYESSQEFIHNVAHLTTPSGVEFIFDPTGAQYGWRDTLVPAAQYIRERTSSVDCPLRYMGDDLPVVFEDWAGRLHYDGDDSRKQFSSQLPHAVDTIRDMVLSSGLRALDNALSARGFFGLDGLVFHLDEYVFNSTSRAILDEVKSAMEANAAFLHCSTFFKVIPVGPDYEDFKVTTSTKMYERWRAIWFSQQEAAACSTRLEALALFDWKRQLVERARNGNA